MDIDEVERSDQLAKFTGRRLDDFELPRNTPAERAETLYQDALANALADNGCCWPGKL